MNKEKLGTLQIVASSVIRGATQGTFPKIVEANSLIITFFRMSIPAALIFMYAYGTGAGMKKIFSKDKIVFHALSLLVVFRVLLFLSAYKLSAISIATLIFFASTVYISVLESKVMGIASSTRNTFLAIASFFAVTVIVLQSGVEVSLTSSEFLGYLLMFLASIIIVFENFFKKKLVSRLQNTEWVFYQSFFGSLMLIPALFIFPLPSVNEFLLLTLFAILAGIVAFMLDVSALRKLRLSSHRIVGFIEPIVAICVGAIFFGEAITLVFVAMTAVVFVSIWYSKKKD